MSDITLTPSQISLIRLMAEYDMNREAVSRVLGCHRNTVTYRLDGIMKITKYDPRVFYDLVELIGLKQVERVPGAAEKAEGGEKADKEYGSGVRTVWTSSRSG